MWDAGIFAAVAAGNEDQDACQFSPASEESIMTVGATNIDDTKVRQAGAVQADPAPWLEKHRRPVSKFDCEKDKSAFNLNPTSLFLRT